MSNMSNMNKNRLIQACWWFRRISHWNSYWSWRWFYNKII